MTLRYAVGIKIRNKADQMTVDAEDALIAALKIKAAHPEAAITYVRKRNARGDRRHPHGHQADESPGHARRRRCGSAGVGRSGIAARQRHLLERFPMTRTRRGSRHLPGIGREMLHASMRTACGLPGRAHSGPVRAQAME